MTIEELQKENGVMLKLLGEEAVIEDKDAQIENDKLRYKLANSELPCVYCGLSKADWIKCESGFPGCARGDDLMLGATEGPEPSE